MNRIENLEIDPHIYDKGAKSNLMEKREYFQQMVLDKLNIHNTKKKKMNLNLNLTSYTKINLKWIVDLNLKH